VLKHFKIWQTLALLVFLVGMPLGSWYYLREGYQYRKSILDDLRQLGELPGLPASDFRDTLLNDGVIGDKVLVVAKVDDTNAPITKVLGGLSDQFAESRMVSFVLICPDSEKAALLLDVFEKSAHYRSDLFILIAASDSSVNEFIGALPDEIQSGQSVLLADANRQIRRLYRVEEKSELKRLVEHIAIVIPAKRSPKPVLKREIEK
jgi:hypothetical protein